MQSERLQIELHVLQQPRNGKGKLRATDRQELTVQLLEPDAKAEFVISNLGDVPEERNGPAGLRNLGATCYVKRFSPLRVLVPF